MHVNDAPEPRMPTPIYAADPAPRTDWFVALCNFIVALFALWVVAHILFPDLGGHQ